MKAILRTSCLAVVFAVISFSLVGAELVNVDVKPERCPNPFPLSSLGGLPVTILGTGDFDVNDIDPASVLLEGVAATRWHLEDVSTPVEQGGDPCDCTVNPADGFTDLCFKFPVQQLVESLEAQLGRELEDREVIALSLTGMTYGGVSLEGGDCIIVIETRAVRVSDGVTK
jgi:hypothetical protein